jgi:hypothetical protein
MAYEAAYGVDISNAEAERMRAPRDVVSYLLPHLGEREGEQQVCLSARAFRACRRELVAVSGAPRQAVSIDAAIAPFLGSDAPREWQRMRQRLGCEYWPRLKRDGTIQRWLGGVETLGEAALEIGRMNPRAFHPEPWTRRELERSLMEITEYELGFPAGKFTVDSEYVADMRID